MSGRRRLAMGLIGMIALMVPSSVAVADDVEIGPRTVIVHDLMGEGDRVEFLFPARAAAGAAAMIARAAAAARVPNRGIMEDDDPEVSGVREFDLRTTLGTRTSFLSRSLQGGVLQALDIFHRGFVIVELPSAAEVATPGAEPAGSTPFIDRYVVRGYAEVRYRIPVSFVVRVAVLLVAVAVLPYVILRRRAAVIDRRDASDIEKVHSLRVAILTSAMSIGFASTLLFLLGGAFSLPDIVLGGLAPSLTRSPAVPLLLGTVLLASVLVVSLVGASLATRPLYRRLRGVEPAKGDARRRARMGLALFLPMLLWLVAVNTLRALLPSAPWVAFLYPAVFVAYLVFFPVLVVRMLPSHRLEEPLRSRLLEMFAEERVRIRDIRAIEARSFKVANAAFMGVLPRFRYVLLTDFLLDRFADDEVRAVVAHEMGHGKGHHVLVKVGGVLLAALVFSGAVLGAHALWPSVQPTLLIAVLPIALVAGVVLVQGGLGLILERRADDYAVRIVGVEPMARALEKLADENMVKRRTGRTWNLLNQHPGIEERVERLRARRDVAAPGTTTA